MKENILQAFAENVKKLGARPCFRFKQEGKWQDMSWTQAEKQVFQSAASLKVLGLKKGQMASIFSSTRPEWTLCDLAVLSLGGITVPIYQSSTTEQAAFILRDSGSRFVFVESEKQCAKVLSRLGELPNLEKIILISGKKTNHEKVMTFEEFLKVGRDRQDHSVWIKGFDQIKRTHTATLVYTSGTTGNPKGAILTHGNFMSEVEACCRLFDITERDVSLLFLPLAHIFARAMQFFQIYVGFVQAYAESIDALVDNMGEIRPHFFVSVPRIFEKVYERVLQQAEAGSALKKAIFAWAVSVGRDISARKQQKKWVLPPLALKGKVAQLLVFKKLQKRLGGRLRYAVSGGAPLSKEISEFFHASGILILEGYGLTETTAAINCNSSKNYRFGTVGPKVYGVEEKIASDGEICVRGPVVFQGYYKNPDATREVLTSDGWFKTGDIGEIAPDGFLRITDRKKDIIVTAAGKNIAPQNIENFLKTIPFVSQVVVHGDRRKYLSALVTLNHQPIEDYAQAKKILFSDFSDLAKHPEILVLVEKAIEEKNKQLASYESIKRFAILENDFTQETGELTPTLKVKRKFVSEKYKDILEQLYSPSQGGTHG